MTLSIHESLDCPKPSHWPEPMARFGKNPTGENIYRVVFAPTVRKMVCGQFADGYVGIRWRQSYPQIGNRWIIEKWISGWDDTKMTPSEYERWGPRDPQSGMLINGPYPYGGTYNEVWAFENGNPQGEIDKIIALVELGKRRTFAEIQRNNRELDAKAEKQDAEQRFLRCREVEPLYGARAANFAGKPKTVNHKSARLPVSANELGLPTSRGKFVARRGPTVDAGIRP